VQPHRQQRGAATLVITLVLLFTMSLVVAYTNRNLLYEQKASANQYRSTQAFEAAEAGLEWALALINSNERLGPDCLPSSDAGSASFRERYLEYVAATGSYTPRTWNDAGASVALQPGCVRTDTGWACSCPSGGNPSLAAPVGAGAYPAFALHFVAADRAGMVHVVATGCDRVVAACIPGAAAGKGDAMARLQVSLGLLPALAKPPQAALTALAGVTASGELRLSNTDSEGAGITVKAGGGIAMPLAHLSTLPGVPVAASLAGNDASLASLGGDAMFSYFLGLDKVRWQQQPGVHSLACPDSCESALELALGPDLTNPLVWVTNDLRLGGARVIGSPEHPVLLVVEGQVQLSAGVVIHGLIYSLAARWDTTGSSSAQVHGAVISNGEVVGDGRPEVFYDPAVLKLLHDNAGSFTRVPGSWRDF